MPGQGQMEGLQGALGNLLLRRKLHSRFWKGAQEVPGPGDFDSTEREPLLSGTVHARLLISISSEAEAQRCRHIGVVLVSADEVRVAAVNTDTGNRHAPELSEGKRVLPF